MKTSFYLFFVLIIFALAITACENESPVNQTSEFQLDTAQFRWEATDMPFDYGFFNGLWASDTDEVFACNVWYGCLLHVKGSQYDVTWNTQEIAYHFIDGFSRTEGYLLCSVLKDSIWHPCIKRWTGSSFVDIPIQYNFRRNFNPMAFYLKSSTEMWAGQTGIIHKFDGTNLTHYYLDDSNVTPTNIFYDRYNKLQFLGMKYIDSNAIYYVYELSGNNWNKIYEDLVINWQRTYKLLNNFIYAFIDNKIYILNGSTLELAMTIPENVYVRAPFTGGSLNDFMCVGGYKKSLLPPALVYWNGNRWSDERITNNPNVYYNDYVVLRKVNDNFYCGFTQNLPINSFIRGFRKQKN